MRRGPRLVKMVVITTQAPGEVGTVAVRGATIRPAHQPNGRAVLAVSAWHRTRP
jgi:hypothetical protein